MKLKSIESMHLLPSQIDYQELAAATSCTKHHSTCNSVLRTQISRTSEERFEAQIAKKIRIFSLSPKLDVLMKKKKSTMETTQKSVLLWTA